MLPPDPSDTVRITSKPKARPAIRPPFRVLAVMIGLAGVFAAVLDWRSFPVVTLVISVIFLVAGLGGEQAEAGGRHRFAAYGELLLQLLDREAVGRSQARLGGGGLLVELQGTAQVAGLAGGVGGRNQPVGEGFSTGAMHPY